jgi:hypothetical protein
LLALALPAYINLAGYRHRRLIRCFESHGVTLVEVEQTALSGHSNQGEPRLRVRRCRLWPERKDCGRDCVRRCSQTWMDYGFNLASLRPFEDHEIKQHTGLPH